MRSALLFAIRLLVPAMVLAYVFAFLAAPCMPLADPAGQAMAIPRWEYWLLHVSVPSAIWWQWTGGNLPVVISDRIPVLLAATSWVACCQVVGSLVSRLDPIRIRLSKYERIGVAVLVGHSALAAIVFLFGTLIGVRSLVWVLGIVVGAAFVWARFQTKQIDPESTEGTIEDVSFASSISRRMIGLLILGTSFLACIQVYGATIPTRDIQVREVDWWLVKHAALDGKIKFSENHALVNAPASFTMPAIAFSSVFMMDLPFHQERKDETIAQREQWQGRMRTSVLAGKTVAAMLGLIGVLLASVHLGRRWGYLSGLFVGFLLVATPGLSELARLGRTEGVVGVWVVGLLVVWHATVDTKQRMASFGLVWWCLVAGALSSGYEAAVLVGLPACCIWFWKQRLSVLLSENKSDLSYANSAIASGPRKLVVVSILVFASGAYFRNAVVSGDPIYPWGRVAAERLGVVQASEMGKGLSYAYRVPSETVFEMIDSSDANSQSVSSSEIKSPYRFANWIDGMFRLIWNSSGHGLMLVPLAIVGGFCCYSFSASRLAIGWFGYWALVWWLFSLRQDRDWMAALLLLAWPAAAGAHWLAAQARGYPMILLVLIAICWSVVVISIWPTSDNRMLVALETLDQNGAAEVETKLLAGEDSRTSYSACFNRLYRQSDEFSSHAKVLLIGESDDFDFLAECESCGPFDQDKLGLGSSKAFGDFLRSGGFTEVVIVWSGVQYREKLTGKKQESSFREAIDEMLGRSQLQAVQWEINSSEAELYRVIKE